MSYSPTVVFDFDGVIHSYTSGWKGAGIVSDPVVPGVKEAIDTLRNDGFKVVVVSTRCNSMEGMAAVRGYLLVNGIEVDDVMSGKPPAVCYIDDRAIQFKGDASVIPEQVRSFKSWTETGAVKGNDCPVSSLRPCLAEIYKDGSKLKVKGSFHGWSQYYDEFETGPGNFPCGIVELDDGSIILPFAENIRFLDRGGDR